MSRYGSEMLALLFEAWEENFPVALTTKSRKFYVGFIVAQASLDPRIRDTRILPILSGYRDEKTARVVFTTDYRVPYATLAARVGAGEDVEDFGIVLPLGEIASAFRFDFDTYQEFGAAPPPGPGDLARG